MAIRSRLNLIARHLTSVSLGKPVRLLVSVHVKSQGRRGPINIEKEIEKDEVHTREEDESISGFTALPLTPQSLSTANQDRTSGT